MIKNEFLQYLAETGHKDAQYQLGVRYCIRNNQLLAKYWLDNAANQGHLVAIDLLGELRKRNLLQM